MKAPYLPKIDHTLDLANIDKMFTREPAQETPEDANMMLKKAKFDNFTFVEDNKLHDVSYTDIN